MDLDEALEISKPLGRSQILILVAVCLMNMETGFTSLGNVFLAKTPPYHCANHSGYSLDESVPFIENKYSTCEEYVNPTLDNETRSCSSWEFETDVAGKSIVSDWSLVCNKDVLPRISQTVVLAGYAIGSLLGGPVSDRYGRCPTIIVALIIFNAIGLSASLAQSYAVFVILRFSMGAVFKAIRIPVMNLLFESLVPRHRPIVGVLPTCFNSIGFMAMAGIAFLVRDWRYLNIILMIPSLIIMMFAWYLPESVRWLLSQNKTKKAEKMMQKIASTNKVSGFPSPVFETNENYLSDKNSTLENAGPEFPTTKKISGFRVLLQLFRQPTLTVTLILSLIWFTCALTYFGFALTTGSLAGNAYLNFFISSAVDMFGFVLSTFLIKRFGTVRMVLFGLTMAAATTTALIILLYINASTTTSNILQTCFALLGRLFITFAIQPTILMMSDLFPTTVRNTGTAIVHLIGNIGSLSSPLLLYVNKYIPNFAFIVIVCFCLIAVVLSTFLPETVGTVQPESPEDLQELFDRKRIINILVKKRGNHQQSNIKSGGPELTTHHQTKE